MVAGGDSFTEHSPVSYCDSSLITDFPRWSAKLAEKLDMEYVNLGKSACNNHYISTSVFEYLMENPKKEIGLVCCPLGENILDCHYITCLIGLQWWGLVFSLLP